MVGLPSRNLLRSTLVVVFFETFGVDGSYNVRVLIADVHDNVRAVD